MSTSEFVTIGKLGRPHGVYGEMRLFLYNPDSDVLEPNIPVVIHAHDGKDVTTELLQVRYANKFALIRFNDLKGRHSIEPFINCEISVPYDALPELDDDEFYHRDLIGMNVFVDGDSKEPLGQVQRFFETGANDVMVVTLRVSKKELFVPMMEDAIVDISISDKRIVVAPLVQWAPADTEA